MASDHQAAGSNPAGRATTVSRVPTQWTFGYEPTDSLPPLAWIAVVRHPRVQVLCGPSVRRTDSAFFEGTWVGGEGLDSVVDSTTTFGSGMVARGEDLFVVPPGHTMEGVYLWRGAGELCGLQHARWPSRCGRP